MCCLPLADNVRAAWHSGGIRQTLCGAQSFEVPQNFHAGYGCHCAKPPVICRHFSRIAPISLRFPNICVMHFSLPANARICFPCFLLTWTITLLFSYLPAKSLLCFGSSTLCLSLYFSSSTICSTIFVLSEKTQKRLWLRPFVQWTKVNFVRMGIAPTIVTLQLNET